MKRSRILSFVFAFLIVIALLFGAYILADVGRNGTEAYDVVFFGDSIIAGARAVWNVTSVLEDISEYRVLNAAVGGMSLSLVDNRNLIGASDNLFTMIGLSRGVKNREFKEHIMSQKDSVMTGDYRYGVSVDLSAVNWDSVRYILIEHGANDYLNGVLLDNAKDKYDVTTYGGALRTSIENIQAGAPRAKVIIVTPIYMNPDGLPGDCYEVDYGGGYLEDYVNKEKEIAAEYGLYVIDNFAEVPINKENYEIYIPGGLHGSLEGNELIASNIARHLKELDGLN